MAVTARRRTGPALGRYEVVSPLGRGATSTVYRARDVVTGAEVALKAVPVDLGLHGRVEREVRAAALLSHHGLVPIVDWGEDDEHLYIVSELVEGRPLDRLLREEAFAGRDDDLLHVVADVLEALEHAHLRGVVHRDVKPANIMVEEEGTARLTDLGVASLEGDTSLTMTGGIVGTVAYMSPEQAVGRLATGASDVYAAALVLYEGLTGRNPILGGGPAEVARRAAAAEYPGLAKMRPDLSSRLTHAVDLALSRDPAARPTPGALAGVLRTAALEWGRGPRALPRATSAAPVLVSAACGALAAGWAATDLMETALTGTAVAAAAGAALVARAPRGGMVALTAAGLVGLAGAAPGAAVLVALAAALLALTAPREAPRAWPLPALAPALMAVGLGPLYAVAVAMLSRGRDRLWAAVAGVAAVMAWQVIAGASQLVMASTEVGSAADALKGVRDPVLVAKRLAEPFAENPAALAGAGLLVLSLVTFPAVVRAERGVRRGMAALTWVAVLCSTQIAFGGAGPIALEALLPAALLVTVWGMRAWSRLLPEPEPRTQAAAGHG